ncbi:ribonuclease III [Salinarimonas soli]|nr:ribonuclease III [Salinarimonas soli]
MIEKPSLDDLEARLGHAFANRDLLRQALTHMSGASGRLDTYQRLEFLGDRVLGLAVGELLYRGFPGDEEGELSRRLAELVRREACAAIADAWDVGPHLRLGLGERKSGGRRNRAILADVCEAVIGAVFLDAGYDAARDVVSRAYGERIRLAGNAPRDPKTALQEWAQGRGLATPVYREVERSGPDHAPQFRIAVAVTGVDDADGVGATKRRAEQEAALAMLVREGIWKDGTDGRADP